MSLDMLEHLGGLDELVQVIYQGAHRFVVLSSVDSVQWRVHLGLSGHEGRWWRGLWSVDDVLELVGPKPSSILLEAFADKLVETIVKGELYISDWSTEKGVPLKVCLHDSNGCSLTTSCLSVLLDAIRLVDTWPNGETTAACSISRAHPGGGCITCH
ncbi:hypothetical protein HGRIS_002398 [Hohenbuehelia grisea]|uniref:Uncharacterized protein n=1 Tax=Hohenbuehelia grisea TaxID=104357 RepID=A0ABR3JKV5_9AGAR